MLGDKRGAVLSATVVITSYNRRNSLHLAYASARAQSWGDTQIIIADDNSSDPKVREYLESLEQTPNLVVFTSDVKDEDRHKTARYATQINTAVQMFATGKYLFFLPDDDWFMQRKVEEQVTAMFQNDWDVSYSSQAIFRDGKQIGQRMATKVLDDAYNIVDHSQVCVSRAAFDAVGGFPDDPQFWSGADAYFWVRLSSKGYKFHPVNKILCRKNDGDGVQSKIFSGRKPWQ